MKHNEYPVDPSDTRTTKERAEERRKASLKTAAKTAKTRNKRLAEERRSRRWKVKEG